VEAAGLKGHRVGGAEVSTRHANFIINVGRAKAEDVNRLIAHIQETVFSKFGVRLELEMWRAGE
jgi:UDP-N-acetylmuramate dehydrogenase